jgi:cell division protein FtsA
MASSKDSHIIGLDVGTTQTIAIVAEAKASGELNVVGIGTHPSRGLRKGVVINLDATVEAIRKAVEEAELMAGTQIERAVVAAAGGHIKGFNSRGVVAVSGRHKEITREDVRRAVNQAKTVTIPADREILHVLPQGYRVDNQSGIDDPVGMTGERLEVSVHIITGSRTYNQNLLSSVNRAGIEVAGMVAGPLAAAEAVLSADEKRLGVALVDIGGGTTDLTVFQGGTLVHTAVVPLGGDNFTNDIAVGLRTPILEAERIKQRSGCALRSLVGEEEVLEVPSMGGRKPRLLTRQLLSEIIQPRAEDILELALKEIQRTGQESALNSGVVLTGGGALLEGHPVIAEQFFDLPVRRGVPTGVGGLVDVVGKPEFASAVGLVVYARTRMHIGEHAQPPERGWKFPGIGSRSREPKTRGLGSRVREWFATLY